MKIEYLILTVAWAAMALLLLFKVPRDKLRDAWLIFLFKQFITWSLGLLVVQFHLIEYPIRLFTNASRSSFTFEFFVYPGICVIFNLYYPRDQPILKKFFHYFSFVTVITCIEWLVEKHTQLIVYLHWSWYWTWITLCATFYLSRKFYGWFFHL